MNKPNVLVIAFIAFVAGCMGGPAVEALVVRPLSAQQVAAGVTRWENQCVHIPAPDSAAAYIAAQNDVGDRMGAEGWELVAMHPNNLCFKRPR